MNRVLSFVSPLGFDWMHLIAGVTGAGIVGALWKLFGYYYDTRLNAIDVLLKLEDCYEQRDSDKKSVRSILESLENDDTYRHYMSPLGAWVERATSSPAQDDDENEPNNAGSNQPKANKAGTNLSKEDKTKLGEIDRVMRFWFKCQCVRRYDIDYGALNTLHRHYLRLFVLNTDGNRKELSDYTKKFWPRVHDWARIVDSCYSPGLGDTTDRLFGRIWQLVSSGKDQ